MLLGELVDESFLVGSLVLLPDGLADGDDELSLLLPLDEPLPMVPLELPLPEVLLSELLLSELLLSELLLEPLPDPLPPLVCANAGVTIRSATATTAKNVLQAMLSSLVRSPAAIARAVEDSK